MPTFKIQHITRYNYDRPVKESVSQIKIFPIEDVNQRLVTFDLQISGNPDVLTFTDYFGNKTGDFSLLPPHNDLTIDSRFVVHTKDDWSEPLNVTITLQDVTDGIKDDIRLIWLSEPEKIQSQHIIEQLLFETEITHKPVVEISKACCNYIYKNFAYKKGITTVETTIDEILDHKSGVCQDFAHVLLQMLRTIGIPARYVSGYICPNKSGMRGEGATHAWVEYYLPGTGWVGLDPTNNVFAGPYHVRLATGRNFTDCTPVKGAFKGLAHQVLSVFVSVGYEDGHVFENSSNVEQSAEIIEGTEPWQDELIAQQQQQQ
ncbi:MAG: transglutaminase family protein [Chitinophagaceae bacterium]|jgi:transglutaminase-like putative cysteine protease|nr:transglutaminase family protein [Chitinophagaceae bacterium]